MYDLPELTSLLRECIDKKASDILIVAGGKLSVKTRGKLENIREEALMPNDTYQIVETIYNAAKRDKKNLDDDGDDDFSFSLPGVGRFRCNVYKQRDSRSAVLRLVTFELPDPKELSIPEEVLSLCDRKAGLVLVTGQAGSGKSTTLSCMIDRVNNTQQGHVITLEDPIEYLHKHRKSLVSQREISHDTKTYDSALRAALRQAPNVILLGEMRDFETIRTVITAAETGQLILSTLHTVGAANTINRIIDVFPPNQQQQIRVQLSMVLEAVVSQRLVPTLDNKLVPAFEIMVATPAIRTMIRESKAHQIDNVLFAGASQGMRTMDMDLLRLYQEKIISAKNALFYSANPETMSKKLPAE